MADSKESYIFDAHAHVLSAGPVVNGGYDVAADTSFRIELMTSCEIRASVLMASHTFDTPNGLADTRRQNDFVAWYRDTHAEHFPVAIGTIEPRHGLEAGVAELHRMREELKLDGVVWHHHFSGGMIDDPRMVRATKELVTLDMPAFIHTNMDGPCEGATALESLAQKVPEARLVALGAFSSHTNIHDMRFIGDRCPNVLFETSLAWPMGQPILHYAEAYGSERLIFGTDMHFNPQRIWYYPTGLRDILQTDRLTSEDKHNILWANAQRLFPALASLI